MPLPLGSATRRRLLAILLLAGCAFSVSFPSPWQGSVRESAGAAAQPPLVVLAAGHNALARLFDRLGGFWGAAGEATRLREENRALREALVRQAEDQRQLHAAEADLAAFDRFRPGIPARAIRVVPACVLAAGTSPWRHSLVVDRGSDHGIRIGTPAVWGNSIVGAVVAIRPAAATVRLLTDGRFGLTVRVIRGGDPTKGEVGLVRGASERGGSLRLDWLQLNPAAKGDLVVTSGLDPQVPPGLVVGEVTSASPTREPVVYGGTVKPLADLARLTELLLVLYEAEDAEELLKEDEAPKGQAGGPK